MSVLLVRVECLCGTIAAFPEGGYFPLCGRCGRRMVCPPSNDYGADCPRRERGMGYVATLMGEQDGVRLGVQERAALGKAELRAWEAEDARNRNRLYSDDDLRAKLEAHGWPTEAPNWPQRLRLDVDDGSTYGVPPWEASGTTV